MKVTLISSVDDPPAEREALERWLEEWAPGADNQGCGCCVDIYEVHLTPASLAALPALHRNAVCNNLDIHGS